MIYIGADHRGFGLKTQIIQWLTKQHIEFQDFGTNSPTTEDDYNDFAIPVSKAVLENPDSFGILICGSAQGMCIQANRFRGIRAAFCHSATEAVETREHNNANILCLSANQSQANSRETISAFQNTEFLNLDRYIRRNHKLDEA